jgi:hypothetical protein
MTGAISNLPPSETQPQHMHQYVHHDAANTATSNITQDAHLIMVTETGTSMNKKPHAIECEEIHIRVEIYQLTLYVTAGIHREQHDQLIAASNGKP